ncbi:MAG: NYN domain-containing protein [Patescibacteria group bacterium]|jgi:uncharacterized LabA/DUF88 family protein
MHTQGKHTHLYIDGQNFVRRIREVLRRRGVQEIDLTKYDLWGLLNHVFQKVDVSLASIYLARVIPHKETVEKSEELVAREATLKAQLEVQGFRYVIAGAVRARGRGEDVQFEEKGVDVSIAVEILRDIYEGKVSTVILASSDSDFQPVIHLAKEKGVRVVYLGFAARYNRGIKAAADETVLIENEVAAKFYGPYRELVSERKGRRGRRRRRG